MKRTLILPAVALLLSLCSGQDAVNQDRVTLAQAKVPLLTGSMCDYHWYPAFNTLHAMCSDSLGLVSGQQLRLVQSPVQQCYTGTDFFIQALSLDIIAKIFVRPQDGSYYCCDIHEPGFGYLFTDCGGGSVFIRQDKLNDTTYLNQAP